jgi:hypothetical protein
VTSKSAPNAAAAARALRIAARFLSTAPTCRFSWAMAILIVLVMQQSRFAKEDSRFRGNDGGGKVSG